MLRDQFKIALDSIVKTPNASQNEYFKLFIFWWGYSSADLDYREQTDFWVLAEVSYWPISLLAIPGLIKLTKGGEGIKSGLLLLLVCGSLQAYNVFFFLSYGYWCSNSFERTIAADRLSKFIYFYMNLLWGIAGTVAAVVAGLALIVNDEDKKSTNKISTNIKRPKTPKKDQ